MSEALDFSRYAPDWGRPQLAWDNPEPPAPGELAQAAIVIKTSARVIGLTLAFAAAVIVRRVRAAAGAWFERLMQSLATAWLVAGSGWGVAIGLAATLILLR